MVTPSPGTKTAPIERELTELCARELAPDKRPRSYEFVDELPKTASGKPLKRVLRDRFQTLPDVSTS